jgi:hypothetical protein
MSADFRAVRPGDHGACVMPMVVASELEEGRNWSVERLTSFCAFCQSLSEMIVAEYAPRYEVRFLPQVPARLGEPLVAGYYCAAD